MFIPTIRSTWSLLLYSQKLSGEDLSPSLYQEMIGRSKSHRILNDNKRIKSIDIGAVRIGSYLGKRSAKPVPSTLCLFALYRMLSCWDIAPVFIRVTMLVTASILPCCWLWSRILPCGEITLSDFEFVNIILSMFLASLLIMPLNEIYTDLCPIPF